MLNERKKTGILPVSQSKMVAQAGVEPATPRFSV